MLAERVAAGELPPVEQRLPDEPAVVTPVESIGQYGGTWRRVAITRFDLGMSGRMGYEPPLRWDRTGKQLAPCVAKSWQLLDGGRTTVIQLRKGMRWSDGHPMTSEDIVYYVNDVLTNGQIMPVYPGFLKIGGERVKVGAPDPYTVVFRFAKPYGLFPAMLAHRGIELLQPKHYAKRFHPKYTPMDELQRKAHQAGHEHWSQLYLAKVLAGAEDNPDLPTLKPFIVKVPPPATRAVCERNPYYWKVDPDGNQLPYIDRIVYTMVQSPEIANFKAMTGDVDYQSRYIDSANYPLFMANRKANDYQVRTDLMPGAVCVYVNPHSHDEELRPILADRRFRIALSLAIDREELIDLIYSGMAEPSRAVASEYDPYYLPEFEKYLEYDPQRAGKLLDEVGLPAGRDGMRRLPNGRPFRQIVHCYPAETGVSTDMWQLVVDYWREVGLHFVIKLDARAYSELSVMNGNTNFFAYATAGMHWAINPAWYVPWSERSFFAPLYGKYYSTDGTGGVKPPTEYRRLIDWYLEMVSAPQEQRRLELGRNILRQWSEQCYTIGIVRRQTLTIINNRFRNVPETVIESYRLMTPGYMHIEQFYIEQE